MLTPKGRTFAKMLCSTWADEDFLTLSDQAKVMYWALVAQPDITPAGIVALTERRWRRYLDGGLDAVNTALDELAEHRFVVIDEDTAEVWVRTFVRHDGRLDNSNLAKSVHRAVGEIRSDRLREACRREHPDAVPRPSQGRSDAVPTPTNTTTGAVPVDNQETPGRRPLEGRCKGVATPEARSQKPAAESHKPAAAASSRDPEPLDEPPGKFTAAVIDHLVGLRLRSQRNIHNPAGYRRTLATELPTEHGQRIEELHERFPTATASSIAAAIDSGDTRPLAPHAT